MWGASPPTLHNPHTGRGVAPRRGMALPLPALRWKGEEAKLVRCTLGAIFDVIIDLRPDSPTYKQWVGEELTAQNRKMLYIPEGFAHGFLTLMDNTEVFYQMSTPYTSKSAAGVRWDDPVFKIHWP